MCGKGQEEGQNGHLQNVQEHVLRILDFLQGIAQHKGAELAPSARYAV